MVLVTKSKPRTSVHEKRRHGQHHPHSGHYLKTYWPYLPLAAIVTVGVICSSLWGAIQKHVLDYATDVSASSLLVDTNNQRSANGLGGLKINAKLNQAAQAKANDMVTRDYWSHDTPDGNPPWVFFTSAGYQYQTAGENLAYGFDSSDAAVTAWMNSPGHRANILNTSYVDVGFGFANSPNYQGTGPETVIVAEYGSPQVLSASSTSPAPTSSVTQPAAQATPPAQVAQAPATPTTPAAEPNTTVVTTTGAVQHKKPQTVGSANVSRVQVLTNGNAPWSMFAVSAFASICVAVFLLRHAVFWHRALIKGESFIIHHKLLDIGLVVVGVLGYILTRSAGVIH